VTYRFGVFCLFVCLSFFFFFFLVPVIRSFRSLLLPPINVTLTAPFLSYLAIDTGIYMFSLLSFLDNALILPVLCCNVVDVNILL
jgi:hypothetical protein